MRCRHKKPPKIWLMTDPRLGDRLLGSVQALPMGSGVIFRHYHLDEAARYSLFQKMQRICKRRGHLLFLAGHESLALAWGADGFHDRTGKPPRSKLMRSSAVHDAHELAEAKQGRADYFFISPIYKTRSHSGARPSGAAAFRRLAQRRGNALVIALGGMNAARAAIQDRRVVHGWAAIDALKI
jgi:thiamine-phosphate pyrophosphorylase